MEFEIVTLSSFHKNKKVICLRSYRRAIQGAASRCQTWRAVRPTPGQPPLSSAARDPRPSCSTRIRRPASNLNSRWSHPPTRGPAAAAAAEISNNSNSSSSNSNPSDVDDEEAENEIHCESVIGRRPRPTEAPTTTRRVIQLS